MNALTSNFNRKLSQYALALMLFSPMLSFGQALPIGGGWQGSLPGFDEVVGVGNYFAESWTFSGPAEVQVTDLYVTGDEFAIYDNGVLIGDSSTVSATPSVPDFTTDPATAWADSAFSHFDDILGAGSHDITIQVLQIPIGYSDSTYSIEGLTAAVPDSSPGILGVLTIGGVLLLGARARRFAKCVS